MTSLSVLCPTRDNGDRVGALLEQVRPIADEIVILANCEVTDEMLSKYATVADRLIRYEFAMPLERHSAWAYAQCTCDWILMLHGDEVVSPRLVSRISEVIQRRDLLQAWLPRRWMAPDASGWLNELPWSPDFSLRLVRNDPAVLWLPGGLHEPPAPVRPAIFLDAPLYHLDCCLTTLPDRERKVAAYEAERPGLRANGGGPINMFYLPERYAIQTPVPLGADDRGAVDAVLSPAAVPSAQIDVPRIPIARRAVIDAAWELRAVGDSARRGSLRLLDADLRFEPCEARELTLMVRNESEVTWPGGEGRRPAICLGYRISEDEGPRSWLPCSLAAGQFMPVQLTVVPPSDEGQHWVEVQLLEEGEEWFGPPLMIGIEVSKYRPPHPGQEP